jgi:hypothetical protein
MPLVAIELLSLEHPWEECPAGGQIVSEVGLSDLVPLNLAWQEHWTEAFLASQARALPDCLGESSAGFTVWRQLADIDLVYINKEKGTAILVELKKQRGSNAKDALCQLARNLSDARQVLASHSLKTIRTVACGEWGRSQLARAKSTVAWQYLVEEQTNPGFVVHAGAADRNGRHYFLLAHDVPPIIGKGRRNDPAWYSELRELARNLSLMLPEGLRLELYRVGSQLVIRCTGDSKVRDRYLGSTVGAPPDPTIAAFLAIEQFLGKQGLRSKRIIGQRLECRVLFGDLNSHDPSQIDRIRLLLRTAAETGCSVPGLPRRSRESGLQVPPMTMRESHERS